MNRGFHGALLDKTAALGLPHKDDFVITHSAALAERGVIAIEEAHDIDGVTSPENMAYLQRQMGWRVTQRTVGYRQDRTPVGVMALSDANEEWDVYPWDFSDYDSQQTGNGRAQLDALKEVSTQDPVTMIWVARIEWVARTMRGTGRPKDAERLRLIDEYYKKRS